MGVYVPGLQRKLLSHPFCAWADVQPLLPSRKWKRCLQHCGLMTQMLGQLDGDSERILAPELC